MVYDFWYNFSDIVGGSKLKGMCSHFYDQPAISFGNGMGSPYRDLAEIVRK